MTDEELAAIDGGTEAMKDEDKPDCLDVLGLALASPRPPTELIMSPAMLETMRRLNATLRPPKQEVAVWSWESFKSALERRGVVDASASADALSRLAGLPVVVDEKLPPGVVELRVNGEVAHRMRFEQGSAGSGAE